MGAEIQNTAYALKRFTSRLFFVFLIFFLFLIYFDVF